MSSRQTALSPKSIAVLKLIAQGHTYEQIIAAYPAFTYLDIFRAAGEAVALLEHNSTLVEQNKNADRLAKVKQQYPRAYEKWTGEEDDRLQNLYRQGMNVKEIAALMQRQEGGISSRLVKLGLATIEINQ